MTRSFKQALVKSNQLSSCLKLEELSTIAEGVFASLNLFHTTDGCITQVYISLAHRYGTYAVY